VSGLALIFACLFQQWARYCAQPMAGAYAGRENKVAEKRQKTPVLREFFYNRSGFFC
jgi:hypothetical protein